MKLHLPVKLRSNLIAAVIAVSAAVYNAQATTYTEPIQQLTSQYQQTAGNTYHAATSITIGTTTPTGDKLITFIEGETTLNTDALIIKNSVMLGATGTAEIHGNTNIEAASSITIEKDSNNQGSRVELVDANVTTAATSVAQASALVIVDGTQDLSDAQKVSLNITGTDLHTDLVHNDTEHTIALGALTNNGSVTLIGNKEHSEATVDADSSVTTAQAWENAAAIVDDGVDLTLDGVTGTGSLNIGNANAAITGDVTQNDLNLVNSATAVTGTVSTKGIELNNESSLVATGDITAGEANSGVSIAGQLQSTGGNISLTNGVHGRGNGLREGASVVATTGNITLDNVGGQSLHGLEAGNEIRLTGSDTIITDTDNIQAGERLTVENGAILRRDTVGDMNDDLTINQGELEDVTIGNVGGDASITDSTLTNTEIGAITGDLTIEATPGNDNTLTNVTIGTVDGDADITNSTLTDTEIGDIDGDADITDSTLEGTAIGNIGGNATISGSTLGDTTTTEEDGSVTTTNSTLGDITGDLTIENGSELTNATIGTVGGNADIDDSTLTGTEIGNITGDLTIENASELTNATIGTVGGDVTINNSTLAGVSTTDEDGNITVDTTTIGTISGALVIENGSDISDTEIAGAGSVAVDDSTVSDTSVTNIKGDITITNDSDVSNTVLTTADEAVTGNITINGSTVTTTTIGLDENNTNGTLAGDIDITNNSTVQGATISATQGHLHIADSTLLGHTDGTTYTKTDIALSGSTTDTLGVTDNANTIASSSVSGTNIELSAPTSNLTVNADSHITGDTNISVGDTLTITGGSELALDGAAQTTDGTDASISADKLVLETLNNNSASIRNGQIHVETQTTIKDGNTLTLTAVNGGTAVDGSTNPGTLGDLVQTTNDGTVNTKLNVLGGSTIETGAIATQDGLSGDKQSLDHYFDQVLVKEDSQLTATETVALRQLYVGSEAGGYTADSGRVGSSVTFEKDAWLVAARVNGNEGAGLDTKLTINGNAHIGTLTPNNGGSVNLVATEDGVHSYIANISSGSYGAPHTALNVVNEELSTPVLRSDFVDLGLKGGTITLERVSAANGATVASTTDVNPHVLVRKITNASAAGAPDGTALGSSTIRTTLNHVSVPYSYSPGEAVTTECRTYYYVARMDGTLDDGRTVTAGQLIERKDLIVTTRTLSDGTIVKIGVTDQDATTLTANDALILDRIDVPALDDNGNLQYAPNGEVLVTGQQVTTELITYYPQATETLGTLETVNDGIASLTVKQNVDADSLTIKAYETGTLDTNNRVVADANTGYITIEGNLTGTHADFTADNNISIAGIVVNDQATDASNTLLSNRGNIAIGANGITGSSNSLTATTGSVSVQGATNGNENVLDAGTSITTGALTGDDNVLTAGTTITVASIDGDRNELTALNGNLTVTGGVDGENNVLSAIRGSLSIGTQAGENAQLTAQKTINIGTLAGKGHTLTAYANGLSQDDVAIHIGSFAAQDSTLHMATTTDPDFGTATGNGSIIIDELTAVDGAPDAALMNNITAGNSYVQLGSLNGFNAYTTITAAKDLIITGTGDNTADNQRWNAANVQLTTLTLSDSVINTGSITGTSLTLTTTGTTTFGSTATGSVTLDSLSLGGYATLTTGRATIGTLTITGTHATLLATNADIGHLILRDGASYDGTNLRADDLDLVNSSMVVARLDDVDTLTLDNSSVTITGAQGFVNRSGDITLENGSTFTTTTGAIATSGNITLSGQSTISSAQGISGAVISVTDSSLTAGAALRASGKLTGTAAQISAASVSAAGMELTDSQLTANGGIALNNNALKLTDSTVNGNITGATSAELTNATTGGIQVNGALTADHSTTGAITGTVTDATITNGSSIGSGFGMTGALTVADSTVNGDITGATSAELTNASTGNVTLTNNGALAADHSTLGAISGASSVDLTNGSTVTGDVAMNGKLTMSGSTVAGSVSGATDAVLTQSSRIEGNLGMNGELTITGGSTITGTVTGASKLTVEDAASVGGVNGNFDEVVIDGSASGAVTATDGSVTVKNGASVNGSITTTAVTAGKNHDISVLTGSTVTGDVTAAGDALVSGSNTTVSGTVSGANVTVADHAQAGSVSTTGTATITDATVTESLTAGTLAADGAILKDATVTNANLSDNTQVSGTLTMNGGALTANHATVNAITGTVSTADLSTSELSGNLRATGDVTMTHATLNGTLSSTGDKVTLTQGASVTEVNAAGSVKVTDSTVDTLTADTLVAQNAQLGTVKADHSTITGGSISGDLTGRPAHTRDASLTGEATVDGTPIAGNVELNKLTISDVSVGGHIHTNELTATAGANTAKEVTTGSLTVNDGASLTATTGNITTNGKLAVAGTLESQNGSVSLGSTDASSAVSGTVKAAQDIATDGTLALNGAELTAGQKVTLGGTVSATETTLTAANGIAVNGTLKAGAGTTLNGTVSGAGRIEKSGGDTLVLADGSSVGSLAVSDGSTLDMAGDAKGSLRVNSASFSNDATLRVSSDLTAGGTDVLQAGTVNGGGATVKLDSVGNIREAAVADQTRLTVINGAVLTSFNADVEHSLDTLNAHMDGGDVVLSKNYKGASKNHNQSQTADALSSINTASVAGTQLGAVLDALAHTRSEADALKALDTLSGRGLAGAQKIVADETHEHVQTMRSTLAAANAGLKHRFAPDGSIIPGLSSNAVTASMTAGHSDVSDNGNSGKYTRNSTGAMVALAHAINSHWSFGADVAYSRGDADCAETSFTSDTIFADVAMMYRNLRFAQMASLGVAFVNMDTERTLGVRAAGHDYAGKAEGSTTGTAVTFSYEATYDLIASEETTTGTRSGRSKHLLSSVVQADAVYASIDDLTENGAGNAGLKAEFDDVAALTAGVGARYTYNFGEETNPGYLNFEVMGVVNAGDSTPKVNNSFIGGSPMFAVEGPESGNAGLRLNASALAPISDDWAVFGTVTSEFRADQTFVGGSVGLKCEF